LIKILNSWGTLWQKNFNSGWIDARAFIFSHQNYQTKRNIKIAYIPLTKHAILDDYDFITYSTNTKIIINQNLTKGLKASIESYERNPQRLNISIIYAKIDNEIKNKRWATATSLAKLYEYLIPYEGGTGYDTHIMDGMYAKIYYLLGFLAEKKGNMTEATQWYEKGYLPFKHFSDNSDVEYHINKHTNLFYFDKDVKTLLEQKLKLKNKYSNELDIEGVSEDTRYSTIWNRTSFGHKYFNQFFDAVQNGKIKNLNSAGLFDRSCEHYSPEYYEDFERYHEFVLKDKSIFNGNNGITFILRQAQLYLMMQKRDPDFKTEKTRFYLAEAIKLNNLDKDNTTTLHINLLSILLLLHEKKYVECLKILETNEFLYDKRPEIAISYAKGICYLNTGNIKLAKQNLELAKINPANIKPPLGYERIFYMRRKYIFDFYEISVAEIDDALAKCK
jgi:hypothetical protein